VNSRAACAGSVTGGIPAATPAAARPSSCSWVRESAALTAAGDSGLAGGQRRASISTRQVWACSVTCAATAAATAAASIRRSDGIRYHRAAPATLAPGGWAWLTPAVTVRRGAGLWFSVAECRRSARLNRNAGPAGATILTSAGPGRIPDLNASASARSRFLPVRARDHLWRAGFGDDSGHAPHRQQRLQRPRAAAGRTERIESRRRTTPGAAPPARPGRAAGRDLVRARQARRRWAAGPGVLVPEGPG
jgi:hypothetical protein